MNGCGWWRLGYVNERKQHRVIYRLVLFILSKKWCTKVSPVYNEFIIKFFQYSINVCSIWLQKFFLMLSIHTGPPVHRYFCESMFMKSCTSRTSWNYYSASFKYSIIYTCTNITLSHTTDPRTINIAVTVAIEQFTIQYYTVRNSLGKSHNGLCLNFSQFYLKVSVNIFYSFSTLLLFCSLHGLLPIPSNLGGQPNGNPSIE